MQIENLLEIPKLGFGFMRLPMQEGKIDISTTKEMVDKYIESGFNYFDTAYVYHNGESEVALKTTVVERYPRESFVIANKLPGWELKSKEDVQRIFDEQLRRTGAGYFDFYLLHSINEANQQSYNDYDCWQWAQDMKKAGLIRHFGFSFHGKPELLDTLLTEHPETEFVQLQINYADWENKIVYSGRCYEIARKHNRPIIIMEPLRGGALAKLKPELEEKMKAITPDKSIASWAVRFDLSLSGVMTMLSGMSAMEQLEDNIKTVKNFAPLSSAEKDCLTEVTKVFLDSPTIGCTDCRYCINECPSKIDISELIRTYNTTLTYGEHERPHFHYAGVTADGHKANTCIDCGKCSHVCPQHIEIPNVMKKISAIFDK